MALLRGLDDHEYWPEYGTLLVRDAVRPGPDRVPVSELLKEYGIDAQPCGSIARAGDGWIDGKASDQHHRVRLEVHDGSPDDDTADWAHAVDWPFVTGGIVALAWVTGGTKEDHLRLGPPGLYRVRVVRRPADEGDLFRLQFWEVDGPPEPPRWLVRSAPLVDPRADAGYRYAGSDLAMLILWAQESRAQLTVDWLADRLLCPAEAVRAILDHASRAGLLTLDSGLGVPLAVTVNPRRPARGGSRQGAPVAADPARTPPATAWIAATRTAPGMSPAAGAAAAMRAEVRLRAVQRPQAGGDPQPAPGAPPRGGAVGSGGEVVVWRDGQPLVLARWPDARIHRAFQTPHGILLCASTEIAIVRPNGTFEALGRNMGMGTAVDPQGRLAATTELHLGRRTRSRVHLIDLSDGSRQTLPWPTEDEVFMVRAVYDGAVYLNARSSQTTLRWRPGTEPESLPYQVQELDPYSGTAKAYRHDTGFVLLAPDGSTRPLTPEAATARLVPGGTLLCHFDYRPAAVRLVAAADSRPPCTSCRTAPKPPRRYPPDPSGTALTTC